VAIEITMPKFGLTMHDGTLQRYFKAPGEPVNAGEPLYEVETEKVLYIVEAPGSVPSHRGCTKKVQQSNAAVWSR